MHNVAVSQFAVFSFLQLTIMAEKHASKKKADRFFICGFYAFLRLRASLNISEVLPVKPFDLSWSSK